MSIDTARINMQVYQDMLSSLQTNRNWTTDEDYIQAWDTLIDTVLSHIDPLTLKRDK